MPAGYVGEGENRYMVRVGDKLDSVDELKQVVLIDLGLDGIGPVCLSDVAAVELVNNAGESYSKVNGNPAIMLSIEKADRVLDRGCDKADPAEIKGDGGR